MNANIHSDKRPRRARLIRIPLLLLVAVVCFGIAFSVKDVCIFEDGTLSYENVFCFESRTNDAFSLPREAITGFSVGKKTSGRRTSGTTYFVIVQTPDISYEMQPVGGKKYAHANGLVERLSRVVESGDDYSYAYYRNLKVMYLGIAAIVAVVLDLFGVFDYLGKLGRRSEAKRAYLDGESL